MSRLIFLSSNACVDMHTLQLRSRVIGRPFSCATMLHRQTLPSHVRARYGIGDEYSSYISARRQQGKPADALSILRTPHRRHGLVGFAVICSLSGFLLASNLHLSQLQVRQCVVMVA